MTASYSRVGDCVPGGQLIFLSMKHGGKYDPYKTPGGKDLLKFLSHEFCGFMPAGVMT